MPPYSALWAASYGELLQQFWDPRRHNGYIAITIAKHSVNSGDSARAFKKYDSRVDVPSLEGLDEQLPL